MNREQKIRDTHCCAIALYKSRVFPRPGEKRTSGYFGPFPGPLEVDFVHGLQVRRVSEPNAPAGMPADAYCSSSRVAVMGSM